MENQINIETMSVIELKALAYDNLGTMQQLQNNINAINQMIDKKLKEQSLAIEPAKQED